MTDDEKRELIAEAHRHVVGESTLSEGDIGDLVACIADLADALEGTLTEPEWEYGTLNRHDQVNIEKLEWIEQSRKIAAVEPGWSAPRVVRRRKAGPWEVVTDDAS